MVEWYDMPGALDDFESHPAYLEKLAIDAVVEVTTDVIPAGEKKKARSVYRRTEDSGIKRQRWRKRTLSRI